MVRRDMAVAKLNIENTVARSKAAASEKNKHKLNPLETSKSREKVRSERKKERRTKTSANNADANASREQPARFFCARTCSCSAPP
jgi:hypothetical protein